ncbi:transcription factor IIIB 60 kDa subunit, putative [Entamoeba dispar SAW760]|uniref:Transcription factor IIIB 60 kDa subunit, putative n=1 Tax=Entamoeba dispar (strain ATCC PRA-260 / SAW760) TaxID=370354 RepID=B0EKV7_ENTDS|nr:transcription factor IIIB 60 kDa subunit, putative [Entamoeba dispar SAW760]EDR24877.1 transcription factor IIIB 60 kDa subunit, putative [Entamoeba dispar SAW760]|eukprot:EDR24877.1 transcription factor IIIB 60 kDa subunit, putative [Entamoeba dispar SAW760]
MSSSDNENVSMEIEVDGNKPNRCSYCGGTEFRNEQGSLICENCGLVIDNSRALIAELQFDESGGKKILAGTQFGETEKKRYDIERQMRAIKKVGEMLKMKSIDIESGQRLYRVAMQTGITKGRKFSYSAGACLYIICRRERSDHLLIDFADVLHVSVRRLGRTFIRFCEELKFDLPFVDPCLYLQRFGEDLAFEKTGDVVRTAMRICQRMNRDWMHYGRRPSGICGVALYLAGRLHGEPRTLEEIVHVVRLSTTTVRVRLKEFLRTPSADLTLEQLNEDDQSTTHCNPPSYTLNRLKDKARETVGANVPLKKRKGNGDEYEAAEDKKLTEEIETLIGGEVSKIMGCKDIDSKPLNLGTLEGKSAKDVGLEGEHFDVEKLVDINKMKEEDFESEGVDEGECAVGDCSEFDNELDGYFLDDKEAEKRKQIWEELNAEFLEKEKKRLEEGEEIPIRKKREKKTKKSHSTFGEAMSEQLKKRSSRINWEVLGKMIEQTEKLAKGEVEIKIEVKDEENDPSLLSQQLEQKNEESSEEDTNDEGGAFFIGDV